MKDEDVKTLVKLVEQRLVINTERLGRFEHRFERNEARMDAQDRAHNDLKLEVTKLMFRYSFWGSLASSALIIVPAIVYWFFQHKP